MVEKLIAGLSALVLTATIATTTPEIQTMELDAGIMPLAAAQWSIVSTSFSSPTMSGGGTRTYLTAPYATNSGNFNQSAYTIIPLATSYPANSGSSTSSISAKTYSNLYFDFDWTFTQNVYSLGGSGSIYFYSKNSGLTTGGTTVSLTSAVSGTATVYTSAGSEVVPASVTVSSNIATLSFTYFSSAPIQRVVIRYTIPSLSMPSASGQRSSSSGSIYEAFWRMYFRPQFEFSTDPPPVDYESWLKLIYNAINSLAGAIAGGNNAQGQILGQIASDLGEIKDVVADPTDMAINQSMQENKEAFADTFLPGGSNNTNENGTSASVTPEQIEQVGEVSQNAQEMIDAGGSVEDAFSWASDSSLFSWFSDQTMQDLDGTAPAGVDDLDLVSYYEDLLADLQSQADADGFIMTRW